MRFTDHLEIGAHTFCLACCHNRIRAVLAINVTTFLLVRLNVDVEDDFLKDLEILPILVEADKFLQDVFRDELVAELPCNDGHT